MKPAPSPAEIDELARQYIALQAKLLEAVLASREAQKPIDPMKADLIELVREFGSTHAEKSKLLHGITHELMATFGTSYSLDAAAVEKFRLALTKAKQARLLKRVFQKDIRWSLSPEATTIIKGTKLSKPLLALYAQCDVPKPKTPTLIVRPKTSVAAS